MFRRLRVIETVYEEFQDCVTTKNHDKRLFIRTKEHDERGRENSLRLPSHVSRSCWRRLPTCFGVLRMPVTSKMKSEINLLRMGNRPSARAERVSTGL